MQLTAVVLTPHSSNFSNVGVGALGVSMNSNSLSEPLTLCGFEDMVAVFSSQLNSRERLSTIQQVQDTDVEESCGVFQLINNGESHSLKLKKGRRKRERQRDILCQNEISA
jgi:hypothetical protein